MNYLAHLFLAGDGDNARLGSVLGDFVKGDPAGRFDAGICEGILLHRRIDRYTDAHPSTGQSRKRFSQRRRRFSGVIVDVCGDHFLSRHWHRFSRRDRTSFIEDAYDLLRRHRGILPARLNRILPMMIEEDWLGSYLHLDRVGVTLDRIAGRLSNGGRFKGAIREVEEHYGRLEADFLRFFPDLVEFVCGADRQNPGSEPTPIGLRLELP
ncbi:MAG: ACP phosphodiesterase [Desulfobacterales bacterium]|nr:ACP phosphodiesterase [Desulfobacterales bacterium]